MCHNYLGQYSINKLWINHNNKYTIIGDISIFPKVGTYFLTKRKLGSLSLYKISIAIYTKRLDVLIILKLINHVAMI